MTAVQSTLKLKTMRIRSGGSPRRSNNTDTDIDTTIPRSQDRHLAIQVDDREVGLDPIETALDPGQNQVPGQAVVGAGADPRAASPLQSLGEGSVVKKRILRCFPHRKESTNAHRHRSREDKKKIRTLLSSRAISTYMYVVVVH